ncbi:non-SMC mitotic condensation complex subunit 1-domain-containing protein [Pavlovales sp. CCMP2436]|nr:non-SMC mitotic condensation complex subunit 1-domain-containing protein [Pavlovales sp. CCMP2436]
MSHNHNNSLGPGLKPTCLPRTSCLRARYPNLLEPWTSHVHRALRDSDARVRVALLSVVAHLTVRKRAMMLFSELAQKSSAPVRKRAKMLFLELAQKSSAPVYNLLPELLSKLTAANAPVDDEGFREIFGYLLGFIEKDKQAESLADRLCSRLAAAGSDEERAVRAVAFCLEKLPPSEKSIRRYRTINMLIERRSAFAHRLSDDDVYASLCEVAAKARRAGKALLTQAADEYEGVLHKLRERSLRGGPADGDDDLERDELGDEAGEDALAELANGTPARGGGRSRPSAAASASKPAAKRASTAKPTAPRVKRGVK